MEKVINYRVKQEYISEDGRRIEAWKKTGTIPLVEEDPNDPTETLEKNELFYGVLLIATQLGPKEIRFAMPDAETLEDAFRAYHDEAREVVKKLEKQQEEYRKTMASKIVQAPASILNDLGQPMEK